MCWTQLLLLSAGSEVPCTSDAHTQLAPTPPPLSHCPYPAGPAGHGSRFIPRTAVAKLVDVVNHVLAFRAEQEAELTKPCGGCGTTLGDVTTMNCTLLKAGDATRLQYNVIPTEAEAGFDCRIPATVDLHAFKARVDGWCAEEGVTWELVAGSADRFLENPASPTDGEAWERFARAVAATGVGLHAPSIYPAATDSRWIRLALGVPCFGTTRAQGAAGWSGAAEVARGHRTRGLGRGSRTGRRRRRTFPAPDAPSFARRLQSDSRHACVAARSRRVRARRGVFGRCAVARSGGSEGVRASDRRRLRSHSHPTTSPPSTITPPFA